MNLNHRDTMRRVKAMSRKELEAEEEEYKKDLPTFTVTISCPGQAEHTIKTKDLIVLYDRGHGMMGSKAGILTLSALLPQAVEEHFGEGRWKELMEAVSLIDDEEV